MYIRTLEEHFKLSDQVFANLFETSRLDVNLFTHEAHLRLVWIHLKKYNLEQSLKKIPTQILNFVNLIGARDKYDDWS